MPPRTILLNASDVGQILGQVLDGQNLVLEKFGDVEKQNTELTRTNVLLEQRVALAEERISVLMLAVAERRKMFQSIAKQTFIGLVKIFFIVSVLMILGVSTREAIMKAIP